MSSSIVFYALPRHTINAMTGKGLNVFDEYASRCVHLSTQVDECTSSFWGDSKMYTFGSIASSQRMPTEINESGAIAKIRISVESDTVKRLKAFRIISSEMAISLLILNRWCFISLHIQVFLLLSYELKMFFQIFVSKVCRSIVLKITAYEKQI